MKNKPLSASEIQEAVDKIRKAYEDYVSTYSKSSKVKQGFENRYWDALQSRADLTTFLQAEIEAIAHLMTAEEDKKKRVLAEKAKKAPPLQEKQGYADRVLEELRKRIEHYPDSPLPEGASYEIRKLYGMFMQFEQDYWPPGNKILRKYSPSIYAEPRRSLEGRVFAFGVTGKFPYPARAERYAALLNRFPRDYNELEKEEKGCILEAAFLLHDLEKEFSEVKNTPSLPDEDEDIVENILKYIYIVLKDFRLTDLKPVQGVI